MIGQILGERYEAQQLLGKKAGRRTLLAHDLETQELVVIKLLSFGSDFEWDSLKLFEREAQTLKSLSHPFIPSYLDYLEVNLPTIKGFALVQSYIPAQTLEQCLQTGRSFTEAEIKEIAKAVLEILIYLHKLHPPVIHRDIKPSNILLSDRSGNSIGQVYLIDFGSVQTVLATEGGTITVVGTYGYMPQEQFGGRTVPASDLYSLGATLIYLLTGTHPADLPQKDFRIQFEQVAHVSPSLIRWLKSMTEPSLERRFSSASAALEALDEPQIESVRTLNVIQPAGSKIQLKKNRNSLEIVFPPVGLNSSTLCTSEGVDPLFFSFITLIWTINLFLYPSKRLNLLLFFLYSILFLMISRFLFPLLKRIRLRLDQQQITFKNELLGFKFNRTYPSPRQDVHLVYISKRFERESKTGNEVNVMPQLILWAGVHKYQLAGANGVINSEPEIEWLAQELSDWLDIPITRE
ncbi:serine/threonine-protein kinase [Nostoc sp. LPT]|uniref:serine/threonine protein kinase n=1 Tax=Nostoc sp. LPT TaxID=2815387 RepID=UPI001DC18AD9|nr:serine/threonine-protein kinase [Nostoc sp. LPT]MBN4003954.1 serine/threonine protein kinase [Nostoc sp. LPT]